MGKSPEMGYPFLHGEDWMLAQQKVWKSGKSVCIKVYLLKTCWRLEESLWKFTYKRLHVVLFIPLGFDHVWHAILFHWTITNSVLNWINCNFIIFQLCKLNTSFSTNLIYVLRNLLPRSLKGAYNSRTFTFLTCITSEN